MPSAAPCPGCGTFPQTFIDSSETEPALCGDCRREPRPWERLYVYGPYEGRLRDLILAYKFQGRLDLGRQLQELALAAYSLRGGDKNRPDLLAPVPLHSRRLRRRGLNQSGEIARLLAAREGIRLDQGALRRVRSTVPQMRLSRPERAENIRGAFAASERVAGRSVLLVDDIMTTGATLEECARTLRHAGAQRVDVLVLAKA